MDDEAGGGDPGAGVVVEEAHPVDVDGLCRVQAVWLYWQKLLSIQFGGSVPNCKSCMPLDHKVASEAWACRACLQNTDTASQLSCIVQ